MAVKQTPLIAQYLSVKQRVPDAILFFRLGDFYEMFFEDAEVGARVLDIQLTSRSKDGVPLCGVPWRATRPPIDLDLWPAAPGDGGGPPGPGMGRGP